MEPAAPWSIIAITFTNKAANEMKERLSNLLGPQAQDIWAMTFHSACCRILRRDIERMGFTRSFTIYDSSDSERIMKEIIKDMELDDKTFPAKYVLGAISREKDKMVSPGEMLDRAERTGDIRAQHIARAYGKYQTRLKDNNALDFDDIIYITVQLFAAERGRFAVLSAQIPVRAGGRVSGHQPYAVPFNVPACQADMRTSAWSATTTRASTASGARPSRTF